MQGALRPAEVLAGSKARRLVVVYEKVRAVSGLEIARSGRRRIAAAGMAWGRDPMATAWTDWWAWRVRQGSAVKVRGGVCMEVHPHLRIHAPRSSTAV